MNYMMDIWFPPPRKPAIDRHAAYLAALKYHLGYLVLQCGMKPREAWRYAKQQAAWYAFTVKSYE